MVYPCDRSLLIKGLASPTICRQFPTTCQQPSLPWHPGIAPNSPKTSPAKETGEGLGDGLEDGLGAGLALGDADGEGLGAAEVLALGIVTTDSGWGANLGGV